MTLVTFNDVGEIRDAIGFGVWEEGDRQPTSLGVGVELPPGVWHTVVANVPGSVLFEVKEGPFDPERAKEFAEWAPAEGGEAAQEYLAALRRKLGIDLLRGEERSFSRRD